MYQVYIGDNLHEMSKPVFWEKKKKPIFLPSILSIRRKKFKNTSCYFSGGEQNGLFGSKQQLSDKASSRPTKVSSEKTLSSSQPSSDSLSDLG